MMSQMLKWSLPRPAKRSIPGLSGILHQIRKLSKGSFPDHTAGMGKVDPDQIELRKYKVFPEHLVRDYAE